MASQSERRQPAGRRLRLPSDSGPRITDRDLEMLAWIGRHGIVTPAQITAKFFSSESAAWRRLRKLSSSGLIRSSRTFWLEPSVITLTPPGARLIPEADVRPAKVVLAEVRHSLAVVDLVEQLAANAPKGTTVQTEREIRTERRRQVAAGERAPSRGRIPDALLVGPEGTTAIELDLTPKYRRDIEAIIVAYLQERYDHVLWYVLPQQVGRMTDIVKGQRADDVFTIEAWEG